MAFHTAWEKDLSPFSAFLGFSSSLETQSSSHSLSIGSLGPCFSTVGIGGGGQLLMGTEGPPTVLCAYAMGEKVPLHFLGEVHFFHESDFFSEPAIATANCKRGSCSQKCLLSFEMELETTARLQAKHAWNRNSTSANQGGMSEDWFGQVEGRQELGWDKSNKFVG